MLAYQNYLTYFVEIVDISLSHSYFQNVCDACVMDGTIICKVTFEHAHLQCKFYITLKVNSGDLSLDTVISLLLLEIEST